MPPFLTRLADGWTRGSDHLPLALVPLLTSLLATEKIGRIATFDGSHLGLRLGLPVGVVDLWQFVSVPNETVGVGLPLSDAWPLALALLPVAVVVRAGLAAGYFGSLADALDTGTFDFVANIRRHIVPFLWYTLVPVAAVAPFVILGLPDARVAAPFVAILIPAFLVAAYLFYATPYLVVLQEDDIVSALRASYGLAVAGGPYFRFAVGYAGFVLATSVAATAVVVNFGVVGVAIGAVAAAPVGLACNAATMRFVADVVDDAPALGRWPDGAASGSRP